MLPKSFLATTLTLALFYGTPTLAADSILNIFCKNDTSNSISKLAVLPSNVGANYFAPDIYFTDENNLRFKNILDYRSYAGDDLHIQMLLLAKTENDKVSLYRSLVHVGRRTGVSQVLAPSREISFSLASALAYRGLSTGLMAKKETTFVFPGTAADEFVVYTLNSGKTESHHLQANLANPRFSKGTDALIFDLLDTKTGLLKQVAYDVQTWKVLFTTPVSKIDALSLEYNPARKNWVWLDFEPSKNNGTLVEASGNSKTSIVKTEGRIALPLVYFFGNTSALQVLWTEMVYTSGEYKDGHRPNIFSRAEAKSLSLPVGSAVARQWPMTKNILDHLDGELPKRLLSGGFKGEDSDKVYFSLDRISGLASLDLKTGAWALVASSMDSCIDPQPNLQGQP